MAENHRTPPATPKGKKPYRKPTVSSEPIYETSALACGKALPTAACISGGKKTS